MKDTSIKLNVIGESCKVPSLISCPSTSSASSDDTIILVGNVKDEPSTSDLSERPSVHEKEKFLPWPNIFEVQQDDVRKDIREELAKGGQVSNRMKCAVIQATFDKMCLFTVYPTTEQYNIAAEAVIKTFPSLTSKSRFCEPYDAVKNALKDKFRNERRHMSSNEVLKKRKKMQSSEEECASKGTPTIIPEGETQETIEMHVKEMKLESTKKKQDLKKVKALMAVTFGHRRSIILERKPITDIRDTYPFLFSPDMIIQDFSTLVGWKDIAEVFFKNLDDFSDSIINLKTNHSKHALEFLLDFKTCMQKDLSPEEKTNTTRTAALLILPSLLKEDKSFLVVNSDDDVNSDVHISTPVATYTGDVFAPSCVRVIAENQECCRCPSIPVAVLVVMGSFYVFDMKYNPKVKGTLTLIQNILCDIKEKGRLSQKLVSLLAKLKA